MIRFVLVAAIAVAFLPAAHAQQPPKPGSAEAKKQARSHFRQGKASLEAGAYDDAIRELEAAYQLFPIPEMQYNLGQAYRMKGERKKALDAFQKSIEANPEAPFADESRNAIAALKKEIEDEEAEAARKRKEAEEAETARQHKLQEEEEARKVAEQQAAAAKAKAAAEAEAARRAAAEAEAQRERQLAEAEAARRAETERRIQRQKDAEEAGHSLRTAGLITGVAGMAIIGAGIFEGIQARDVQSRIESTTGYWTTDLDTKVQEGQDDNTRMLILVAAGGAAVATGTVLYLLGVHNRHEAMSHVAVAPTFGPDTAGLVVAGSF